MKSNNTIIGIDLGGTKLAIGKVDGRDIQNKNNIILPLNSNKDAILNIIKEEIQKLIDPGVVGIGIGVPSVVDTKNGIVYDVQNIPSWDEVPLKKILEAEFQVNVEINNDVNCFALGEQLHGKAKGFNNIVGLSIGTGIGAGVIVDGKLMEGNTCGAGEVGMIPYREYNYEYYCSGQYFINEFKMNGEEAYHLAKGGNNQALMIFDYFATHFGNALLAVIYAYDPEIIVIGGSVTKAREFYEEKALEIANNVVYRITKSKVKICFSELENVAIYGATRLIALNT